jgi:hypothetical protein
VPNQPKHKERIVSDFTPGPWRVDTTRGFPWHVHTDDTICRIGGHETAIEDEETNEKNALLISTAPDLLAACQALLAHVSNQNYGRDEQSKLVKARNLARAAIARATGNT